MGIDGWGDGYRTMNGHMDRRVDRLVNGWDDG